MPILVVLFYHSNVPFNYINIVVVFCSMVLYQRSSKGGDCRSLETWKWSGVSAMAWSGTQALAAGSHP